MQAMPVASVMVDGNRAGASGAGAMRAGKCGAVARFVVAVLEDMG